MPLITRIAAASSAAILLALAVPLSATAAIPPYTPPKPDTWVTTVHACSAVVTHDVPSGTFAATTPLQLAVTGASGAPTVAAFTASQVGATLLSDRAGGAQIRLEFGLAARGVYDVTLVQQGTQRVSYGVITLDNTCAAAAVDPPARPLARTGTTIDFQVVWGAAVAAGLGLALWAFTAFRSRRRRPRTSRVR